MRQTFLFFFLQRLESKKPTYIYPKIVGRDVLLMITFPLLLAKSLIQTSPFLTTNANLLGLLRSVQSLSHVRLFATTCTIASQAHSPWNSPGKNYWSGLPFPSPGDLPSSGIEPRSTTLQEDYLPSEPPGKPLYLSLSHRFSVSLSLSIYIIYLQTDI